MQSSRIEADYAEERPTPSYEVSIGDHGPADPIDQQQRRLGAIVIINDLNRQWGSVPRGNTTGHEAGDEYVGIRHRVTVSSSDHFHKRTTPQHRGARSRTTAHQTRRRHQSSTGTRGRERGMIPAWSRVRCKTS